MSDVALTTYVYRIHAHGNWEQTLDLDEAKHLGQLLIEGSRDEYLGEWLDDTGDICIARTPTSSPAADFLEDTESSCRPLLAR